MLSALLCFRILQFDGVEFFVSRKRAEVCLFVQLFVDFVGFLSTFSGAFEIKITLYICLNSKKFFRNIVDII